MEGKINKEKYLEYQNAIEFVFRNKKQSKSFDIGYHDHLHEVKVDKKTPKNQNKKHQQRFIF